MCVVSGTCGAAVALEHNGDVCSGDHVVEPVYRLGNITETPLADLLRSDRHARVARDKRDALPELCRSCDGRVAGQGGC